VEQDPELVTAEMLDGMTPDERAQAFNAHIIADLEQLPLHFRNEVVQNAKRLSEDLLRPTEQ
jgi:hypothetical protein